MATHLSITELQIGTTQTITGISTSINGSNSTIPTSKAVKDFVDNLSKPVSLSVVGNWANTQYTSQPVNTAGLIFTVTYGSGKTASVSPSVSPSTWSSTAGTQTATFSYTENGVTVSASKSASVIRKLTSLTISGSWTNTQYTGQAVNYTGLTFTASYNNNTTATVTPSSYSPTTWGSTAGTQSCTFYYSENGITVNASKSASVVEPWYAVSITLTNPNSALAFRSISGTLYTNSACTSVASTNTKYTGTTFYYKSNTSRPSGSYLYNYGDGATSDSEPSKDSLTTYYNEGSLTACLGTDGYCWSGTKKGATPYWRIQLSDGKWTIWLPGPTVIFHRVRSSTF